MLRQADINVALGFLIFVCLLIPESRFLKVCEEDKFCSFKLSRMIKAHGGSLAAAIRALYNRLDSAKPGTDECADLMQTLSGKDVKPSLGLRNFLGRQIQNDPTRILVPALLHRVYMCRPEDVAFLKRYLKISDNSETPVPTQPPTAIDVVMSNAEFLSSLIKASEMWASPSPSWADEKERFEEGLFSTSVAEDYNMICFLRGDFSDPMCDHLIETNPNIDFNSLKTTPYVYKPDKYWKKYASIPSHASVMAINGGLDFLTPREWGSAEYEGLQGDGGSKILLNFDTGTHCAGISLQTMSDRTFCGYRAITSFVLESGNISNVDVSCIEDLPALDFADLTAIWRKVLVSTADELYDSESSKL